MGSDIKNKARMAKILPWAREKAGIASSPKAVPLTMFPMIKALRMPSTRSASQLPKIMKMELHAPIAVTMDAAWPWVNPKPCVYGE